MQAKEEISLLLLGAEKVVSLEELGQKVERARRADRPLRVKYGADPTAPDLHLGHVIPLQKLRLFQELGHKVVFIIGDFTARIGDPSGQSATRPMLSAEEVEKNAKTYIEQVRKVLDLSRLEIRQNSQWLEHMGLDALLRLCGKYTVARMIDREDFRRRLEGGQPIGIHEILYPLLQAYDSVVVEADVEVGGSDQLFNFLVGREIQRSFGQEPQVAFTLPILAGTDGVRKMSKSLGNYIGISELPLEMFGKVMAISDELMRHYARLLLAVGEKEANQCPEEVSVSVFGISNKERKKLSEMLSGRGSQLKEAKKFFSSLLVRRFHGEGAAMAARAEWERIFERGEVAEAAVLEVSLPAGSYELVELLLRCCLVGSKSEAKRLIRQGAVEVGSKRITEAGAPIEIGQGMKVTLRVGRKKFARVRGTEEGRMKKKGSCP